MNKLAKIINTLGKEELELLQRDLVSGNVDKLVKKRLEMFEPMLGEKQCPVCGGPVNDESFVLEFGKRYLRKKAYFDGLDCMFYFLNTKVKKQN